MRWDAEGRETCFAMNHSTAFKISTLRLNQGTRKCQIVCDGTVWNASSHDVCTPHSKPTDYYSTSEGYKAANQMLRMSPAGITISHICLLTVSNLCLHFAKQILPAENFNILTFPESHPAVRENLDF